MNTESLTGLLAAAGDADLDPAPVRVPAAVLVVVALVRMQFRWASARSAGSGCLIVGAASRSGSNSIESWVLPAERSTVNGIPRESIGKWYFERFFPRSTGLGPISLPPFGPHRHRIDTVTLPVDRLQLAELVEDDLMEPFSHQGLLPLPEPAPARDPGSERHLGAKVAPPTTGGQQEHNALQRRAVRRLWPPARPLAAGGGGTKVSSKDHSSSVTSRYGGEETRLDIPPIIIVHDRSRRERHTV